MIRAARPSSASRAGSPSGRISTATAPILLSAETTVSALGRVCMRTPTCSPWRTPISIRPRTTLSTPLLDRLVGVGTVLEEQDDVVGCPLGLLVEQQPERDPRPRADPTEAVELIELSGGVADDLAHRPARTDGRAEESVRHANARADRELCARADPVEATGPALWRLNRLLDPLDALGQLAVAGTPLEPVGDGRPG